ncbi:MAG: hypothetical protein P4L44_12910 [Oryzomonas sp.]|uniref:hypothetical protein n=1 Tax=Oryzomonas sp. TaxID=2855186 RepID=UPI0028471D48|nr:hypothetical protein [Oryzomonas sp.]MDR3580854.1 hypothetical protein [Oryzomonas sp.]
MPAAKLDYLRIVFYGILLVVLSSLVAIVATILITKQSGTAIVLGSVTPVILLVIYFVVIFKCPGKFGICTTDGQNNWQIKLIMIISIIGYVIASLWMLYAESQIVGKIMLLITPIFILIGKAIDSYLKRNSIAK